MRVGSIISNLFSKKPISKITKKVKDDIPKLKDTFLYDGFKCGKSGERPLPVIAEMFDPTSPNHHILSLYG